ISSVRVQATNGIIKDGDSLKIGGDLTGATFINLNGQSFNIIGDSTSFQVGKNFFNASYTGNTRKNIVINNDRVYISNLKEVSEGVEEETSISIDYDSLII